MGAQRERRRELAWKTTRARRRLHPSSGYSSSSSLSTSSRPCGVRKRKAKDQSRRLHRLFHQSVDGTAPPPGWESDEIDDEVLVLANAALAKPMTKALARGACSGLKMFLMNHLKTYTEAKAEDYLRKRGMLHLYEAYKMFDNLDVFRREGPPFPQRWPSPPPQHPPPSPPPPPAVSDPAVLEMTEVKEVKDTGSDLPDYVDSTSGRMRTSSRLRNTLNIGETGKAKSNKEQVQPAQPVRPVPQVRRVRVQPSLPVRPAEPSEQAQPVSELPRLPPGFPTQRSKLSQWYRQFAEQTDTEMSGQPSVAEPAQPPQPPQPAQPAARPPTQLPRPVRRSIFTKSPYPPLRPESPKTKQVGMQPPPRQQSPKAQQVQPPGMQPRPPPGLQPTPEQHLQSLGMQPLPPPRPQPSAAQPVQPLGMQPLPPPVQSPRLQFPAPQLEPVQRTEKGKGKDPEKAPLVEGAEKRYITCPWGKHGRAWECVLDGCYRRLRESKDVNQDARRTIRPPAPSLIRSPERTNTLNPDTAETPSIRVSSDTPTAPPTTGKEPIAPQKPPAPLNSSLFMEPVPRIDLPFSGVSKAAHPPASQFFSPDSPDRLTPSTVLKRPAPAEAEAEADPPNSRNLPQRERPRKTAKKFYDFLNQTREVKQLPLSDARSSHSALTISHASDESAKSDENPDSDGMF